MRLWVWPQKVGYQSHDKSPLTLPGTRSLRSWKVNCWSNLCLGTRVGTWKSMKHLCSVCSCCCLVLVTMLMGYIMGIYYTFHIWFMLYMYIIFNDLMKCILYTWGWLMPRVGRRFAVPLGCFHGVVVCSSIPRMGCTRGCQNYETMCKSYNQWEFQDPKLEVPTIYKAYFSGLNFREYPHKIWPKIWY